VLGEDNSGARNLAGSLEAASRNEHKKCDSTAIVYSMKVRIYIYAKV
jgi:hypothetical protein